jgi:hypothetical protein
MEVVVVVVPVSCELVHDAGDGVVGWESWDREREI